MYLKLKQEWLFTGMQKFESNTVCKKKLRGKKITFAFSLIPSAMIYEVNASLISSFAAKYLPKIKDSFIFYFPVNYLIPYILKPMSLFKDK